jgi:hypothetical protein
LSCVDRWSFVLVDLFNWCRSNRMDEDIKQREPDSECMYPRESKKTTSLRTKKNSAKKTSCVNEGLIVKRTNQVALQSSQSNQSFQPNNPSTQDELLPSISFNTQTHHHSPPPPTAEVQTKQSPQSKHSKERCVTRRCASPQHPHHQTSNNAISQFQYKRYSVLLPPGPPLNPPTRLCKIELRLPLEKDALGSFEVGVLGLPSLGVALQSRLESGRLRACWF